MKQIVTIPLILTLFTSQVGYYFLYTLCQYEAKEQMKERLMADMPDSALQIVEVDPNNSSFIWQEEGKEFLLNNQLYDVAKTKEINGKTFLYCLSDTKEQEILQDLSKAVKAGNDNNNTKGKHTIKFLLDYFLMEKTKEVLNSNPDRLRKYGDFAVNLQTSIQEVTFPPPRLM